jgi:hypothetical protein
MQGLGSGSTWIHIQLFAWIRISIPNADPDREAGKYTQKRRKINSLRPEKNENKYRRMG